MNEHIMGNRIRSMRLHLGLTMEELGGILGVGKSAVNKWEKGHVKNIKRSTIAHMAVIFNCSPVWLMGLDAETISPDVTVTNKSGVDTIRIEDINLTSEEKSIINKFRADERFKQIIRSLNEYDNTTPVSTPKTTGKNAFKVTDNVKRVAKTRKVDDLA